MDTQPRSQRLRPQIYVRIEFGLSFSQQNPKHHELTYKSRRLRESPSGFPRRVPAPNTNYLSVPAGQSSRQIEDVTHDQPLDEQQHVGLGITHEITAEPSSERRRSRAESVSSHERRRSAPPPFGDNPWDLSVPQRQAAAIQPSSTATATANNTNRPPPELWKSLPEVPSRFRLGEDGMPWSPYDPPLGYEPIDYPHEQDNEGSALLQSHHRDTESRDLYDATPRPSEAPAISIVSPVSPIRGSTFEDPERAHNLESLSAAMMTVDNGFEDQWWYQGTRQTTTNAAPSQAPNPASNPQAYFPQGSLGWAVASPPSRHDRIPSEMADLVSPVSDSASSIDPPTFCSLTRTLTTRSEELFLY